jgi:hypothetical protein
MNKKYIIIISVFIFFYFILSMTAGIYTDYQWFTAYGGLNVFWTLFFTKFNVHLVFSLLFAGLFLLNFLLIKVLGGKGRIFTSNILNKINIPGVGSPAKVLFLILLAGVAFVSYILGEAASSYWQEYLMFMNGGEFTGFPADPIFLKDISFYVFSLPFYQFLYGWTLSSLIVIAIFSVVFHFLNGGIYIGETRFELSLFSRTHISILLGIIIALFGLGYRLSSYELLFSEAGRFFGAGYTAVNGKLLAYTAAMIICFIAAALMFVNVALKSFKLPALILAALIPVNFIIGTVLPSIQQKFIVEPNELDREKQYIVNNIKYTRKAYDIEKIKEVDFANTQNLTQRDISNNRDIIDNIRLWDWRPLKQTFKQLQELKPYYFFNDVDIDRYVIDGKKIAINLAARELSIDGLSRQSQTWQNRHLMYTHGYGLVMSAVAEATNEGQPRMLVYDIPPKSSIDIKIERPEIYYGEHNNSYVITNTTVKPGEFDYPSGDENKYTVYAGTGGVKLDSFFKRLMFAISFKDKNILISENIISDSRVHYRRNITSMVKTLAPFLQLDDDPYIVTADGKLYWIIDAYTSSDRFPYSTPINLESGKINYIRNSVKIVIDAYNGAMNLYISEPDDPIIKAYAKIFPGVFKEMSAMPEYLTAHVRYPDSLFSIQSQILLRYHMTDPNVFYNNEDAWHIPRQIYENSEVPVQSYYLVTRLPDESRNEFIVLLPFTPFNKNNMIAFLTAKCDYPDYGELKLYRLPKEKLSYGPLQIEARINQDPDISKQLSLWNQKGSNVIRGNMLAIPIEESILYVEPLYLKADTSEMPELIQVVVAFGDRIVMEKDLATSLQRLFYKGGAVEEAPRAGQTSEQRLKELSERAYTHYNRADQARREGNWAEYGKELGELKRTLETMRGVR